MPLICTQMLHMYIDFDPVSPFANPVAICLCNSCYVLTLRVKHGNERGCGKEAGRVVHSDIR